MISRFEKANLKCPICGARTALDNDKTLFCKGEKRHTYDISASEYLNLASPKQCGGGDTKGAVKSRSAFLDRGYYQPIADKVVDILKKYATEYPKIIDAGCGEGYYTLQMAQYSEMVLGFDISKFAVEAGAKRAKRDGKENVAFCVASVYTMPVFDDSADAVVNIFAPCVEEEYFRVLKSGGILIVVHAGKDHLMGLKRVLYDSAYENDTRADLPVNLALVFNENLKYTIKLESSDDIKELFAMTPYYWRTSLEDAKKLECVECLETDVDIIFSVYKKI